MYLPTQHQSFFTALKQCWRQGTGETGRVISEVEAMREKWLLKEGWLPVGSLVSGFRFKLPQLGRSPSKVSVPASSSIHLVLMPSSFSLTPTHSACFQREGENAGGDLVYVLPPGCDCGQGLPRSSQHNHPLVGLAAHSQSQW